MPKWLNVMVQLRPTKNDDSQFVRLLQNVVEGILAEAESDDLYVVTIDNWFDHKWLKFSGIGVVPFEFPAFMNREDALGEFHQDNVTLPPFSPKRVVCQSHFHKQGAAYIETDRPILIHGQERQRSEENLNRRIESVSESGTFVWYSSNTVVNARASIMAYTTKKAQVEAWFAAFRNVNGWKLHLTKGINRDRVQGFLIP
ncbi:MAG: hypothetical protein ACLQMT_01675 [Candidatus Acidiferrales bacterium]